MIRVRVLEEEIKDAKLNPFGGDILTLDDELAQRWIGFGWAEDVTGKFKTGRRPAGEVDLAIQTSHIGVKSEFNG